MRLSSLEPEWVWGFNPVTHSHYSEPVLPANTIAQGIIFLCPSCFRKNRGPEGTHSILVWFAHRDVPPTAEPLPRWTVASGSTFEDLTLTPSIDLTKDSKGSVVRPHEWHGFITCGNAI